MTQAVCFNCGDMKWGAFNHCENCGAMPRSDDELMLSLACTDHYFDLETLRRIGGDIKLGKVPQLGEDNRKKLFPAVQEAKKLIGINTRQGQRASQPSGASLARRVARGIGAFLLFFVVYAVIGSFVGALVVIVPVSRFFSVPSDGSLPDIVLKLCSAVASGFLGVKLGSAALSAVMKDYPGRGVGAAFVMWLVANYTLHFIYYPENTDDEVYIGLIQSLVACVTAWFVFRLPPLAPQLDTAKSS